MIARRKCWIGWVVPLTAIACMAALMGSCSSSSRSGPPYGPTEALKTFQIEPGFHMEVFATEPDVISPAAMEFDEYGRLYVVEDPGYPLDTENKVGRVKLLEDTDGNGLPDRTTIFADKLVLPTGVMRWKKGVLITDAPNVWYMEDKDGDGKADEKRIVLTGFPFTNPQHTVNSPIYGLDNWIYLASKRHIEANVFASKFGDKGADIRFPERTDIPPLNSHERNVRFRPDTYQIEALSGYSQFGQSFDEWGNQFEVENPTAGRHEVIAARYLERNPDLLIPSSMQELTESRDVYPITERPESPRVGEGPGGRLSSACGITLYLGGAFPEGYEHAAFTADPANNLVFCTLLTPAGASFAGRRLHKDKEFLASTDAWSRPVNFYVGPDAALYMVDYYRRVIEHPEWTSRQIYESPAIYEGNDRGRIYRIVPDSNPPPLATKIRLGDASDEELVKQLASPNIWWRRTAQRLLVDRKSAAAVAPLVQLFETSSSGIARVHALWALEGLGKLDKSLIDKALQDPEAGVRRNAIILAESRLSASPELARKLLDMSADTNPAVRFQLLCTLGFVNSPTSKGAREKLLAQNMEDPWVQVAALSSSSDDAQRFFDMAVSSLASSTTPGRTTFFRQVASVIGARRKESEVGHLLQAVSADSGPNSEWWRTASLEGLTQGIRARGAASGELKADRQELLLRLFAGSAPSVRRAALELLEVSGLEARPSTTAALKRATALVENKEYDPDLRSDAIGLMGLVDPASHTGLLKTLIDPKEPEQVQIAAVKAIGKAKGEEIGTFLISNWRTMTPAVRNEAAEALFLEPGRTRMFLESLSDETVPRWTLSSRYKYRLLMNKDESIRRSAEQVLAINVGERDEVVKQYAKAIQMDGDLGRGRQTFEKTCSKCHQLNGFGAHVGPDLGEVRNRPPQTLLEDILDPSKAITQGYESYVVEMATGGTIDGVIGPQTPTTITLRQEEGKEQIVRRADIKSFHLASLSAMPADLEKELSVQQMADLLRYMKTGH